MAGRATRSSFRRSSIAARQLSTCPGKIRPGMGAAIASFMRTWRRASRAASLSSFSWGSPGALDPLKSEFDAKYVKHAARLGAELGADIVKVNYTGSPGSFHEVVAGCPVPVVIAGGEKVETDEELLQMVEGALKAGSAGASIGRNAFQHADPEGMMRAISMIVHENASVKEAKKLLASRK